MDCLDDAFKSCQLLITHRPLVLLKKTVCMDVGITAELFLR